MYDDDNNLYINDKDNHSLIIGSNGSKKMETIILPMVKLAIKANESFVINSTNEEIYSQLAYQLENKCL